MSWDDRLRTAIKAALTIADGGGLPILPLVEIVCQYAARLAVSTLFGGANVPPNGVCVVACEPLISSPEDCAVWTPEGGDAKYLLFTAHHSIHFIDLASETYGVLAGMRNAHGTVNSSLADSRFDKVRYIAVHPIEQNTIFVSESHRIRQIKVTSAPSSSGGLTGVVSTLAGSTYPGLWGSGALARFTDVQGITIAPSGSALFVCDRGNEAVRRVAIPTGKVTSPYHNHRIPKPQAIALQPIPAAKADTKADSKVDVKADAASEDDPILYVSQPGLASSLMRLQWRRGAQRVAFAPAGQTFDIRGMTFLTPTVLLVSCVHSHALYRIDIKADTGAVRNGAQQSLRATVQAFSPAPKFVTKPGPGWCDGAISDCAYNKPTGLCVETVDTGLFRVFVADKANSAVRALHLPDSALERPKLPLPPPEPLEPAAPLPDNFTSLFS